MKARANREKTATASNSNRSDDVEMTPVPQIQRDERAQPTKDKGKARDPAEGKGFVTRDAGVSLSSTSDLDFLNSLWALDDNGNPLPSLKAPTTSFKRARGRMDEEGLAVG